MIFKKITALILAVVLVSAISFAAHAEGVQGLPEVTLDTIIGDLDLNGRVNINDATELQRFLLAERAPESLEMLRVMDVDGDGRVSILDATMLQRYAAEMPAGDLVGKRLGEVYPEATPDEAEPFEFTLSAHELTLGVGEYYGLKLISEAEEQPKANFTSGDSSVAEVGEDGEIVAKAAGVAEISCECGGTTDVCTVTVCPAATSLTLNKTALTLGVGEIYDLNSTINSGAAAYHRIYSGNNEKVASVEADGGLVTAKAAGTATVSCTLLNGVKADCVVTVLPASQKLTLNKTEVALSVGETFDFNSSVPSGTAAFHRAYYSEDEGIVSITKSGGLASAVKTGTTRIYCETMSGVRAYATVTVLPALRTIMINHLRAQIGKNNTSYVSYINSHSNLNISYSFPWCAVFAWCTLDQFATKASKKNPVKACCHVSDIAVQARAKGALHNRLDNDYMPKPGDAFTTSAISRPYNNARDHIGFVESVETDSKGRITKVHTIEGNFAWETEGALETIVWRGEWVPGVKNKYGSALCEFIDLEKLFS